jgi:hypothetical protein
MAATQWVHMAQSEKDNRLPEMGSAKPCVRGECPAPNFEAGFGLAGGGYGVYEYCNVCGEIVSKTQVNDE